MNRAADPDAGSNFLPACLHYLSFRARSTAEMRSYLAQKGASLDQIEDVLTHLTDLNLIDDNAFAAQFIRSRLNRGYGDQKINADMRQKGFSASQIQTYLKDIPLQDKITSAQNFAAKKAARWQNQPKMALRQSLYRLLAGRGFTAQTISAVIDELGSKE